MVNYFYEHKKDGLKIELWTMIPIILLFTLSYIKLLDWTITEYLIKNSMVILGIGLIYISDFTYKSLRRKDDTIK